MVSKIPQNGPSRKRKMMSKSFYSAVTIQNLYSHCTKFVFCTKFHEKLLMGSPGNRETYTKTIGQKTPQNVL